MSCPSAADLQARTEAEAEACLVGALRRAAPGGELAGGFLWTEDLARGELAANHALRSAGALGLAPCKLAEALAAAAALPEAFAALEAARPGFLNFRLSAFWYDRVLDALCAQPCGPEPDFSAGRFPGLDPALADRQDAASPLYRLRWAYTRSRTLLEDAKAAPDAAGWEAPERLLLLRLIAPAGDGAGALPSPETCRAVFASADAFCAFYAARPLREADGAIRARRLRLLTAFCRRVERVLQ